MYVATDPLVPGCKLVCVNQYGERFLICLFYTFTSLHLCSEKGSRRGTPVVNLRVGRGAAARDVPNPGARGSSRWAPPLWTRDIVRGGFHSPGAT